MKRRVERREEKGPAGLCSFFSSSVACEMSAASSCSLAGSIASSVSTFFSSLPAAAMRAFSRAISPRTYTAQGQKDRHTEADLQNLPLDVQHVQLRLLLLVLHLQGLHHLLLVAARDDARAQALQLGLARRNVALNLHQCQEDNEDQEDNEERADFLQPLQYVGQRLLPPLLLFYHKRLTTQRTGTAPNVDISDSNTETHINQTAPGFPYQIDRNRVF